VADVGSGEFLGEMSLLWGSPRNATATATTDLGVLVSSASEFRSILRIAPTVADKVFHTSMERAATVEFAPAVAA
jgi:CRP-like cAMP-binding protein